MNGSHDMGGMHGLGPIEREADEPAFHHDWEARMLGLRRAMTSPPGFSIDRFRFLRESMPGRKKQRYGDADFDWECRVDTTSATVRFTSSSSLNCARVAS